MSALEPRQILLVNMMTDLLPAMAIAVRPPVDRSPERLLSEGPESSLKEALTSDIVLRGVTTAAGATAAWGAARVTGRGRRASTVGLLALVGTQLGQTLVTGGRSPSVIATVAGSSAALAAAVQTPGVSQFFGCTPVGPVGWGIAVGSSAAATGASVLLRPVAERFLPNAKT
jgi:magnesium-transporting ATPase (P-type)